MENDRIVQEEITTVTTIEKEFRSQKLILQTGKVAKQAHGAVTVQYGDTVVLATVVSAPSTREIDYFPLQVEYREMQYAGGKFPGGFFKREGRPSTKEVLTSRMVDRTLRPLFPDDFCDEVQIQCVVVSADKDNDADILAVIGASAALAISHVPFQGPIGAVRIGRINNQFILFPTYHERNEGDLDLVIAGPTEGINMIEMDGQEIPEDVVVEACRFGMKYIQQIITIIKELANKAGKEKSYQAHPIDEELLRIIEERYGERIRQVKQIASKKARWEAMVNLREEVLAELTNEQDEQSWQAKDVHKAFYKVEGKIQRELILSGIRPDGRGYDDIRPITIEVPALPRTHGSALFTRGETQSLATVTLGTPRDMQKIDWVQEEYFKRFMLHYNFPPFCVGEIRPIRGPSRREIGHGALAEKSIEPVLPSQDDFAYTIRVVSEILESNGSSSMASVCSASLALMNAGVPIKRPVAGVSIGMVREGDKKVLLTDIIGEEDFHGDMDFKVAGTRQGITGVQLDFKPLGGLDLETIAETLARARDARFRILEKMDSVISKPGPEVSIYAPKVVTVKIDPEKIGKIIGTGGKTINALQSKHGVTIEIEEDGTVWIISDDMEKVEKAKAEIEAMTEEVEIGKIYKGKVVGVKDFGAFVEILPGQDGLCHISQLADRHIDNVSDICKVGDSMPVKVIGIDEQGRIKLSRKAAMREMQGRENNKGQKGQR
ncbi:MAG: polyribonucleotide nucleotidyltransferase [Planctomycetes bacterium]|nr:polyribonucleotide nucleotidyltransferase [Planctomycetota bacterium]